MAAHVHAENMKLFAEDAMKTDKPWYQWEYDNGAGWQQLRQLPSWGETILYRRRPEKTPDIIYYVNVAHAGQGFNTHYTADLAEKAITRELLQLLGCVAVVRFEFDGDTKELLRANVIRNYKHGRDDR